MNEPRRTVDERLWKGGGILFLLFSSSLVLLGQVAPNDCAQKKLLGFKDYPVTAYHGKPHTPILATPLDRKYETAIRDATKSGVNFAGHYTLARWGCGTGCHEFVIADLITGVVYDPSFDEVDFHNGPMDYDPGWQCYSDVITYQRDSSLLVVEGCLRGKQCGRTYFVMEFGHLRQVAYNPDRLRNGKIAPF